MTIELAVGHGGGVGGARTAVEQGDLPKISPSWKMLSTMSSPSADATLTLTAPATDFREPVRVALGENRGPERQPPVFMYEPRCSITGRREIAEKRVIAEQRQFVPNAFRRPFIS